MSGSFSAILAAEESSGVAREYAWNVLFMCVFFLGALAVLFWWLRR